MIATSVFCSPSVFPQPIGNSRYFQLSLFLANRQLEVFSALPLFSQSANGDTFSSLFLANQQLDVFSALPLFSQSATRGNDHNPEEEPTQPPTRTHITDPIPPKAARFYSFRGGRCLSTESVHRLTFPRTCRRKARRSR